MGCVDCGREIRSYEQRVHYEMVGWVPKRSDGGGNQIRWGKYTGNVLCPQCAKDREHYGGKRPAERQTSLFGEGQ